MLEAYRQESSKISTQSGLHVPMGEGMDRPSQIPERGPSVSFVIPAWNEEVQLQGCLDAIAGALEGLLEPEAYEVLVVDDASTDSTAAIALTAGARVLAVDLHQISAVRNAGARVARGARLVFVDADTRVSRELLQAAFRALDSGAVGGGAPIRFDANLPFARALIVRLTLAVFRLLTLAGGCFLFVDRAAFEAAGGFSEELFGAEEIALARALKRHGRFVLLRTSVRSSARKMLAYSPWEIFTMTSSQLLRGRRAFRSREGLEVWYGPRRRA